MEYLFIYTLQMAVAIDGLKFLLFIGFCIIAFLEIGVVIGSVEDDEKTVKIFKPIVNKSFVILISILIVTFLFPTKETLLLWGGTYYGKQTINQVVNSEKYKKISELIDLKLDNLIKEEKGNKQWKK